MDELEDLYIKCANCEARMDLSRTKKKLRFSAHCPGCGAQAFGPIARLIEAEGEEDGYILCKHLPPVNLCKDGSTYYSNCNLCQVRYFIYNLMNERLLAPNEK